MDNNILNKIVEIVSENGYIPHIYSSIDIDYGDLDKYLNRLVDDGKIRRIRKWRNDGTPKFIKYREDVITPDFEESYTIFEIGSGGIKQMKYGDGEYDYIYSDEYESLINILSIVGPINVSQFTRYNIFKKKPGPKLYSPTQHRGILDPVIDPNTDFSSTRRFGAKKTSYEDEILGKVLVLMIKNGVLNDTINYKNNSNSVNTYFYESFSNASLEISKEFERDRKLNNILNE